MTDYIPSAKIRHKKYKQRPARNNPDYISDAMIRAKPSGWRQTTDGRWYFENRTNRSDTEAQRRKHGRKIGKGKSVDRTHAVTRVKKMKSSSKTPASRKRDSQAPTRYAVITPKMPPRKKNRQQLHKLDTSKELTKAELEKLIVKYGKKIQAADVEHSATFDRKYGLYHTNTGGRHSVAYNSIISGSKYIHIHNHPDGMKIPSVFSGADISIMLMYNLYEIRVFSHGYMYTLRKGKCVTSAYMIKALWDAECKNIGKKLSLEFPVYLNESQIAYDRRREKFRLEKHRKYYAELETAFRKFCKEYKLEYHRRKLP